MNIYIVTGRFNNGQVQELDRASTEAEAEYWANRYQQIFGDNWEIKIEVARLGVPLYAEK